MAEQPLNPERPLGPKNSALQAKKAAERAALLKPYDPGQATPEERAKVEAKLADLIARKLPGASGFDPSTGTATGIKGGVEVPQTLSFKPMEPEAPRMPPNLGTHVSSFAAPGYIGTSAGGVNAVRGMGASSEAAAVSNSSGLSGGLGGAAAGGALGILTGGGVGRIAGGVVGGAVAGPAGSAIGSYIGSKIIPGESSGSGGDMSSYAPSTSGINTYPAAGTPSAEENTFLLRQISKNLTTLVNDGIKTINRPGSGSGKY